MQTLPLRMILIVMVLTIFLPFSIEAETERRIALVIGNGAYSSGPLKNPVNDATDVADTLRNLGFQVLLKMNVRHQEMEEAVEDFGHRLRRGGVGLFYYAGHGVQVGGVNYLIPIGARINKDSDVKHQALSTEKILDEMAYAQNGLNIVLLDACRDNPFAKSMRSSSRGLAIISAAPEGTFISYATGPGQTARDGDGRNSPYTAALLKNMRRPGLPIESVFKQVRIELSSQKQTPWELSSLKGEFYFVGGPSEAAEDSAFPRRQNPPERLSSIQPDDSRRQMALTLAQRAFREKKFAEPQGDNVLEYLKTILLEDPENAMARDLEKRAIVAYENEAEYALMKKDEKRSTEIYQRLFSLYPDQKQYLDKIADLGQAAVPDISGIWYPTHVSGQAYFGSDGKAIYKGFLIISVGGIWTCRNPRKRIFSIAWNHGFTDVMTLSPDGQKLEGINNVGDPVCFVRNK